MVQGPATQRVRRKTGGAGVGQGESVADVACMDILRSRGRGCMDAKGADRRTQAGRAKRMCVRRNMQLRNSVPHLPGPI